MKLRAKTFAVTSAALLTASLAAGLLAGQAPATAATSAASTPQCAAADLGVWVAADHGQGAAGSVYMPLEFTNLSGHTCTMYGYPGVAALSSNLRQLGSPAQRSGGQPHTVTLPPGATANATLTYSDVVTGNCPSQYKRTAFELQIYPPDQTQTDHALWPYVTCTAPYSQPFLTIRFITPGFGLQS